MIIMIIISSISDSMQRCGMMEIYTSLSAQGNGMGMEHTHDGVMHDGRREDPQGVSL